MAAFLLRNIAFCIYDGHNFAYAADLAIFGEHFQNCAVDRTRNFHYSLVILYFHYDIVIGYFVAGFDMHFDNFAFMQTFAQLREPVLKFCHLNNLLKVLWSIALIRNGCRPYRRTAARRILRIPLLSSQLRLHVQE
ncbi:hypothetical protein D3C75_729560 [compost metagenome]